MTVRSVDRRGKRILVIDITYRGSDGALQRHRRDSVATTLAGAREEERLLRERIARTGSPYETNPEQREPVLYREVVQRYRTTYMQTQLKATTRRGYDVVLETHLLPKLGDRKITDIDGRAAWELDFELARRSGRKKGKKIQSSTRNNVQIVLRSTLRFAKQQGWIETMPPSLPALRRPEQTVLSIPTDQQVSMILAHASRCARPALLLMAHAGLRPNEVRALRAGDVRWSSAERGELVVREGVSFGERHSPKTGQRQIPMTPALALELNACAQLPPSAPIAITGKGKPWGQWGLDQAFRRAVRRAGLSGWSVYTLRHYAITTWLRAGIRVHVVQKMAGHKHLSTTQGYLHLVDGDLEQAARLLEARFAAAAE